jgi:hypothetical protein
MTGGNKRQSSCPFSERSRERSISLLCRTEFLSRRVLFIRNRIATDARSVLKERSHDLYLHRDHGGWVTWVQLQGLNGQLSPQVPST